MINSRVINCGVNEKKVDHTIHFVYYRFSAICLATYTPDALA